MSELHVVGLKTYFKVITALVILTVITVWASFNDFGAMNTPVMLVIAFVKALIVAAIFMHLKYSARIVWVFAGSSVLFLFVLISFVVGDIMGKNWQYKAQGWEHPPVAAAVSATHHP